VNELRMAGFAMFNASPDEQRMAATQMNRWWETKRWRPLIGASLPLAQAAEAHALQEANTLHKQGTLTGKIVVKVAQGLVPRGQG
jgi:NADPH:quinone reductase